MVRDLNKTPLVKYRNDTLPIDCPFGQVQRIVTGGEGGVANVHVVTVTEGKPHTHKNYDEVYYVLSGEGIISIDSKEYPLHPGAVAVIPAGKVHSLVADEGQKLEFIIFGNPPISINDPDAIPQKA